MNINSQVFHILGGGGKNHSGGLNISAKGMNEAKLVLIKPQVIYSVHGKAVKEELRGVANII